MPTRSRSRKRPPVRKATKRRVTKRKVSRGAVAKRAAKPKAPKSKVTKRKRAKPAFKVFIAWSGDESNCLASKLQKRLRTIVPNIQILFSPVFNPGDAWVRSIQSAIRDANYAILCVTKQSLDSRWMNFEAGAAWKTLKQEKICPLLLDVDARDLTGPLSLFQAKQFAAEEFEALCRYLAGKTRLNPVQFKDNFDGVWNTLKTEVDECLEKRKQSKKP